MKTHCVTVLRDVKSGAAMSATQSAPKIMSIGPDHFVNRSDNKEINSAYCNQCADRTSKFSGKRLVKSKADSDAA